MNLEVKKMFLSKPMVYFQNARKISSYLVRAKLHRLCRNVGPKYLVQEYGKSAKKSVILIRLTVVPPEKSIKLISSLTLGLSLLKRLHQYPWRL